MLSKAVLCNSDGKSNSDNEEKAKDLVGKATLLDASKNDVKFAFNVLSALLIKVLEMTLTPDEEHDFTANLEVDGAITSLLVTQRFCRFIETQMFSMWTMICKDST